GVCAQMPVIGASLVSLSIEVVEMSDRLAEPVDVIFGAQLGGRTDIAQAVTYAAGLVTEPDKTIFLLISDLYEGGLSSQLLAQLSQLKESKVKVVCLLVLTAEGAPGFSRSLAARLRDRILPVFAD